MKAYPAEKCVDPFPDAPVDPTSVNPVNVQIPVSFRSGTEYPIGSTTYDLQSNNSVDDRISRGPNGEIYGAWTMSLTQDYGDRGSGYNKTTDGAWGDQPTARVESVRIGWPSHVVTASGTEMLISHAGAPAVHVARREAGSDTWSEYDIPSDILPGNGGPGILWPRATASGENVHVIAISYPIANGGSEYAGVDGHPLYYRSTDGGVTWDKVDIILPGLDSTSINSGTADGYAIDSRGNTVAVLFTEGWSDVILMKSEDNGETWTKTVLNDFPLDRYVIDAGYTYEDLPPFDEAAGQPDSLAILSNDEAGAVIIDNDGMVHAFWGRMWVQDDDLTDGNWTFYPGTGGIAYWNETFGPDSIRTIADVEDLNGNDTLDIASIDNIANYGVSLTSHPSAGIDAYGNIYLAYSAVMEGDAFFNLEDNQHYRHIYLTASPDGGATWTAPYDIINEDIVLEPDLIAFTEAVFPALARDVGENVELIYQQDFRPGLAVQGDMDPYEVNFINFVSVPLVDLGIVRTEEPVQPEFFQLEVQPNPARDEAWASFELERNARYTLSLHNLMGRKVADVDTDDAFGHSLQRIDLSGLPAGLYLVRLQAEDKVAVAKVMVQ